MGVLLGVLLAVAGIAGIAGSAGSGGGGGGARRAGRAAAAAAAATVPNVISDRRVQDISLDSIRRVDPEVETVEELHVVVVETGDFVCLAGRTVAAAGDLDLSAAVQYNSVSFPSPRHKGLIQLFSSPVEELGFVGLRAMEANVLSTNKVLARGGVLGDLELELRHAVSAPGILGEVAVLVAEGLLPDLEPFAIALVLLDIAGRRLGHDWAKLR